MHNETTHSKTHATEVALADALKAGVISSATLDYHRACCQQEGGLARFKAFAQAAMHLKHSATRHP